MSSFLYLAGKKAAQARKMTVLIWVILIALLGTLTVFNAGELDNSVEIPGTESGDALEQMAATFPQMSGSSAQIVVTGPAPIDQGASADAINAATDALGTWDEIEAVTPLVDEHMAAPISADETTALIMIQLSAETMPVPDEVKDALIDAGQELNNNLPEGYTAHLGGALFAQEFPEVSATEVLGVIVAFIVLTFTLGTLLAAGMPLVVALAGVAVSMTLLFIGAGQFTINATTPLLAVMLGLAVGIDYSLFIVSRHRDQLKQGEPVVASIGQALGTAGSAVVFAGITVMIALLGLGVAGISFLTMMGIAGAGAVGIAVIASLTLLPALLSFAGLRVLTKKERATLAQTPLQKEENTGEVEATSNRFFSAWINTATRRPAVTTVLVVLILAALALPLSNLRLALPDAGVLPKDNEARINYQVVAEKFGEGYNGPLIVMTPIVTSTDPLGLMDDLKTEIEALPGVDSVALATPNLSADTGIVQVIPTGAPDSEETEALVHTLRDKHSYLEDTYGVDIAVTGYTAVGIDVSQKLSDALLPFALVVVGLSLVLLGIVFRSVAVPVTAALGYLLTVGATFGITVMVFEWGFLADLLQVTRLGPIINFMPIVTMGILFGLSMDYEVFLVSRMRENYVKTGQAKESIVSGFLGSAKVVTAAAVIMVAVFTAFVPEGDMSLKPIAFGLAVGVAIDAFIVRMTLIPAVMVWLGDKAWWLPAWLDRMLPILDIEGESVTRQRSLEHWPTENHTVAANDLLLFPGDNPLSFLLQPGKSLVVTGDPRRVRSLLRALSGRQEPEGGNLKVLGMLTPERASGIRRKVAYMEAGPPTSNGAVQLARQVDRAMKERAPLIAVDLGENLQAAAGLAQLSRTSGSSPTVIVGATRLPQLPDTLVAENPQDWQILKLAAPTAPERAL